MKTHRVTFDVNQEEHRKIKMCCVKLGVSLKDFITKAALDKVEKYESNAALKEI